jgi:DNA excision repair protein ERCC-3
LYQNKGALHCKNLKIELKAFTKLRDYQSEALKAVVQQTGTTNAKVAKSGYIVLPCGAGKTLLGIAICAKIKKETLIVCSSDSGAEQWKR